MSGQEDEMLADFTVGWIYHFRKRGIAEISCQVRTSKQGSFRRVATTNGPTRSPRQGASEHAVATSPAYNSQATPNQPFAVRSARTSSAGPDYKFVHQTHHGQRTNLQVSPEVERQFDGKTDSVLFLESLAEPKDPCCALGPNCYSDRLCCGSGTTERPGSPGRTSEPTICLSTISN